MTTARSANAPAVSAPAQPFCLRDILQRRPDDKMATARVQQLGAEPPQLREGQQRMINGPRRRPRMH